MQISCKPVKYDVLYIFIYSMIKVTSRFVDLEKKKKKKADGKIINKLVNNPAYYLYHFDPP